jgi:hypothetical protein
MIDPIPELTHHLILHRAHCMQQTHPSLRIRAMTRIRTFPQCHVCMAFGPWNELVIYIRGRGSCDCHCQYPRGILLTYINPHHVWKRKRSIMKAFTATKSSTYRRHAPMQKLIGRDRVLIPSRSSFRRCVGTERGSGTKRGYCLPPKAHTSLSKPRSAHSALRLPNAGRDPSSAEAEFEKNFQCRVERMGGGKIEALPTGLAQFRSFQGNDVLILGKTMKSSDCVINLACQPKVWQSLLREQLTSRPQLLFLLCSTHIHTLPHLEVGK